MRLSACIGVWVLVGVLSAAAVRHDFHASVTQMVYNPATKTFELSIRMFTDDLEEALSRKAGHRIQLSKPGNHDALLEQYVRANLICANAKRVAIPLTYIGHEGEADATWLYVSLPFAESFTGSVMKLTLLTELFDDQVNMLNVQYQGQKKTFVFRKEKPVQPLAF